MFSTAGSDSPGQTDIYYRLERSGGQEYRGKTEEEHATVSSFRIVLAMCLVAHRLLYISSRRLHGSRISLILG